MTDSVRGIRQGNENSEVYIGYYSTKGTFDNYRWQILGKKIGGVTRLCNLYEHIPEQIHGLNAELEQAKKQLANAKEQYGKPFQNEEQLRAGLERQAQINAELEVADKPHEEAVMGDCSNDESEEMEM